MNDFSAYMFGMATGMAFGSLIWIWWLIKIKILIMKYGTQNRSNVNYGGKD